MKSYAKVALFQAALFSHVFQKTAYKHKVDYPNTCLCFPSYGRNFIKITSKCCWEKSQVWDAGKV